MADGRQIIRRWNLLKQLQCRGEGISLLELMEEYGVSDRAIQRDIRFLRDMGFPIEYDANEYGKRYWRLQHDFFKAGPLVLSLTEAFSLALASELFIPLAGTHYADAMEDILTKIQRIVPRKALDYFASADRIIYVRQTAITNYAPYRDTVRLLDASVRELKTVNVTYQALGQSKPFTTMFDPYGLVYYEGDLFVLGHSYHAKEMRIFKVSRIQAGRATSRQFKLPKDFDLEKLFRSSFGIIQTNTPSTVVQVRFTGFAATLVQERRWHESQRLASMPEDDATIDDDETAPGALLATFRLSDFTEFKRWIKGFDDHAEVLIPDWLRQEIRNELLAAAKLYE